MNKKLGKRKPTWVVNGVRYGGRRPKDSYRAVRRNYIRDSKNSSKWCKAERLANNETRSEFDKRRWLEARAA